MTHTNPWAAVPTAVPPHTSSGHHHDASATSPTPTTPARPEIRSLGDTLWPRRYAVDGVQVHHHDTDDLTCANCQPSPRHCEHAAALRRWLDSAPNTTPRAQNGHRGASFFDTATP